MKRPVIPALKASFDKEVIYEFTLSLFPSVSGSNEQVCLEGNHINPWEIYSEIEDAFLDEKEKETDPERKDFLEAAEIMSWAIYRAWHRSLKEASIPFNIPQHLQKEDVFSLFLENLRNEEDPTFLQKIESASIRLP